MTEPTKTAGHQALAVKLPPDLHAQLELICGLEGRTMGAGLLLAVEHYVQAKRSEPDFAERAAAAVAEAEAEAAAKRSAIQALLGQTTSAVASGPVPDGLESGRSGRRGRGDGAAS